MKSTNVISVIRCDCYSEIITVEHDDTYEETYLAMWTHYPAIGWRERIRWIWNLIRTGRPFNDMICLNEGSRKALIEALSKSREG